MRALLLSLIPTSTALLSIYLDRVRFRRLNLRLDQFVVTIDASLDRLALTLDASLERLEKRVECIGPLQSQHRGPVA